METSIPLTPPTASLSLADAPESPPKSPLEHIAADMEGTVDVSLDDGEEEDVPVTPKSPPAPILVPVEPIAIQLAPSTPSNTSAPFALVEPETPSAPANVQSFSERDTEEKKPMENVETAESSGWRREQEVEGDIHIYGILVVGFNHLIGPEI
ncbi:hypothetical protein BT69DRAFT_1303732, partial [Atractiella rhizophila]